MWLEFLFPLYLFEYLIEVTVYLTLELSLFISKPSIVDTMWPVFCVEVDLNSVLQTHSLS